MKMAELLDKLQKQPQWDGEEITFDIPRETGLGQLIEFLYPLAYQANTSKPFKLFGSCTYFSMEEYLSILYLLGLLQNFSSNITVKSRGDSIRFEAQIKSEEQEDSLIIQYKYTNNEGYKYVQLTNIVIPPFAKYNKISLMIVAGLSYIARNEGYDFWVVQIVNERWQDSLIHHGGIIDESGDIQADENFWVYGNVFDRKCYELNFNVLR